MRKNYPWRSVVADFLYEKQPCTPLKHQTVHQLYKKQTIAENMNFTFKNLYFKIENQKITLSLTENGAYLPFSQVQIAGENKNSHCGVKIVNTSQSDLLKLIGKTQDENNLVIEQQSDKINVKTYFSSPTRGTAVAIYSVVKNISEKDIVIEECPAVVLGGIAPKSSADEVFLYKFMQSHHCECQPKKISLFSAGLSMAMPDGQHRICGQNVGSWSTKEELPQGIIETFGRYIAFQIESNSSWYYELSDFGGDVYLCLGGASYTFGGWCKKLAKGQKYRTNNVAVCFSDSLDGVIGELTGYRRSIAGECEADKDLPVIFNEYMHLSWDSPDENRTRTIAPSVKAAGAEYYVIDCGWHNEEKGDEVYPYVGQWKQSKARFPGGLRKTTDYLRSVGLKAGLWIEPEIIGYKCREMLDFYDDDCFITRHGEKVCVMGRYFLDYRNEKVRNYMSETIRRMVEDYGADYIKTDYNQDMGAGTELNAYSVGEGLELCANAFLEWFSEQKKRFPQVLFEACASGGMRMDYKTLSHFSIMSTSDQVDYKKYPYIAANVLSGVLPEQAAVWSYPVGSVGPIGGYFDPSPEWVEENISAEQVIMNMINSFLGRMHLSSHIERLSGAKFALVKQGVSYYNSLTNAKKTACPVFPLGFADFKKTYACAGLKTDKKLYLAVWSTGGGETLDIPVGNYKNARISYPENDRTVGYELKNGVLTVRFTQKYQARFFELDRL